MFNNLTKEIVYYSLIPVTIIALIILFLIIIGKKKSDNYYKYNYSIKVFLSILVAFILSIMIGYTIWVYERVINLGTIKGNILYMILLAIVVIALFISLVFILYKLYQSLNYSNEEEKEFQNE